MRVTTWRQLAIATASLVRPALADRGQGFGSRRAPRGARAALLASTAAVAAGMVVGAGCASAAPVFTQGGDASFRNITASGGTLAGVDVSNATVLVNGTSMALTALALQAAQAVPASLAGQPNGWLKLDANGMVPTSALPAAASGVDQTARSAAAAAQSLASAAEPAAMAGKTGGWAPLDANALVPVASLPASVTNPVDGTARSAAAAAQSLAAAAEPAAMAGKTGGWAPLDANALVPVASLPSSVTNPVDGTARSAAAAAQSLAAAAEPANMAGKAGGWAPLDANALVPVASLPASVTNPIDSAARSAAAAAQSVAAAAVPSSSANKAGGYPQLDGNALVPMAALPAAYTASTAIPNSSLGSANGPARLDASGSLSANKAAATASAVQRSLAAHFADVVDAADYGMKCDFQTLTDLTATQGSAVVSSASYTFTQADVGRTFAGGYQLGQSGAVTITSVNGNGSANISSAAPQSVSGTGYANLWTDDTAALKAAVGVATTRLGGADLVLPGGQCELSGEVDVADSTSLRIRGAGNQATNLMWTSQTNGLIVTETNQASLTIGDFMISKFPGTNGATTFIGTALSVGGATDAATGENKIGDITIQGSSPAGQIDGWNQGLVENNLAHAFTANVSVLQPGPPVPASGTPSPLTPTAAEPAANGFGVAADVVLEGTGGGYYIDGAIDDLTTTGGDVSLDATSIQGAYITNTKLTYANFGLRVDSPNTTSELINFSNSYVIANLLDLYLNGVGDSQITGNMFWPNATSAAWAGVWLRNTNSDEVTGNGFLGHVGTNSVADYGIYVSSDGQAGFPHTIMGNTLYYIHGTGISNSAVTGGVDAVGNVIVAATVATSDPGYGPNGTGNGPAAATAGMGNLYFANILNGLTAMSDDGQRNIQFAKNLTCGNLYDACTFTVKSTGTNVFQVDTAGDVTATGTLSSGSMVGHATIFLSEASYGNATMTTNQGTPSISTLGPLLTGLERIKGALTCISGSAIAVFNFDGLWGGSTFGPLPGHFALSSGDGSAIPSGWSVTPGAMAGASGTPATSGYPELTLTGAPSPTDCSAHLEETAVQ